ncbi:MAG: hypothetical protein RL701_6170 [Pseudomonadota bacterium]|jgi:hypothetical protein
MTKSCSTLLGVVAFASMMMMTVRTHASTALEASLADLVRRSEFVFRGVVLDKKVSRASDGSLWTGYKFDVVDAIIGKTNDKTFSLRCYGGLSAEGDGTSVDGIPDYDLGEEMIIFFDEDDGLCNVTAWSQGSLRILRSPSGEKMVLTEAGYPVAGIRDDGLLVSSRPEWVKPRGSSQMTIVPRAAGVRPKELPSALTKPKPADVGAFVEGLRSYGATKKAGVLKTTESSRSMVGSNRAFGMPSEGGKP